MCLKKQENKVTQSTLRSFKAKIAKIGYTFHPLRIPPYIFFKMCNPFYIGLKLPNVNEALWNRMGRGWNQHSFAPSEPLPISHFPSQPPKDAKTEVHFGGCKPMLARPKPSRALVPGLQIMRHAVLEKTVHCVPHRSVPTTHKNS